MGKARAQMAEAGFDDSVIRRQIALINSMTKKERANPDILQASRKKRIAAGAGLDVAELNRLLKMHRQMADLMKRMGKGGMLRQAMKGMFGKGAPSEAEIAAAREQMARGQMPPGISLPRGFGGGMQLPPGLSGLGGFGKKK
jgi:signal recognition particle subunit SRP54